MSEIPVSIEGVNGIRSLSWTFGPPGLYVLEGSNGAGKSSAMEALRAACGDRAAVAEPTDGTESGEVRVGGVRMIVGAKRLLNGLPSMHLADDSPIGKLVEPGIKDPRAANRARIDALMLLVPLPADDAAKKELTDGDFDFASTIRGHFPSALAFGDEVKSRAHALALESEKRAAELEGEVGVLMRDLGAVPAATSTLTVADAEKTYEMMTRRAIEARAQAQARVDLERRQAEIGEKIGERPSLIEVWESADKAKIRYSNAEMEAASARMAMKAAEKALSDTLVADEKWVGQSEILRRPVEGPTLAEADTAEKARSTAAEMLEAAKAAEQQRATRERLGNAKTKQDKAAAEGERFRKLAKRVPYALGRVLKRAGIAGLTVDDDGILCMVDERGVLVPFADRLSFGQRVSIALECAIHANRARESSVPCALMLESEFYLGLDAQHKQELRELVEAKGLYMLTEVPNHGPLRVEGPT